MAQRHDGIWKITAAARQITVYTITVLLLLVFFSGTARAAERLGLLVVDVDRIFHESVPGKAGEAHLEQVRDTLQRGMDQFLALHEGMEDDEAQATLHEVQAALERQFAVERLAVQQVLATHLEQVIRTWFAVASERRNAPRAVVPASAFFVYNPNMDITDVIMVEMNKVRPVFPSLPTVTVQPNPN